METIVLATGFACFAAATPCVASQVSFDDTIYHQQVSSARYGDAIDSGDVNGDGILDLAVVDSWWNLAGRGWVLLGPDYQIEIPIAMPGTIPGDYMGLEGKAWSLADVTGDGYDDVLVSGSRSYAGTLQQNTGRALVCLGPDFQSVIELPHPDLSQAMGFGTKMLAHDLTGDGVLDVLVGSSNAEGPGGEPNVGRIDLFVGGDLENGSIHSVSPPPPYIANLWGSVLLAADYDKDGVTDLLTSNRTLELSIGFSWIGSFDPLDHFDWAFPLTLSVGFVFGNSLLHDMNGDGCLDYVAANTGVEKHQAAISYGATHDTGIKFEEPEYDGSSEWGDGLGFGDFNRDGVPDIAIGGPGLDDDADNFNVGRVLIHYGPDYTEIQTLEGAHPHAWFGTGIHVLDLNGDGFDELFVGAGAEFGGRLHLFQHHTLRLTGATEIPVATGGQADFSIEVGPSSGASLYLLALGASGSEPGSTLPLASGGTLHVPLNADALTFAAIGASGSPAFAGFVGVTDAGGTAGATLTLGPLANPALAGTVLTAAAVVFDGALLPSYATEAVSLPLVP